jgi:hypothetical protein
VKVLDVCRVGRVNAFVVKTNPLEEYAKRNPTLQFREVQRRAR